ncbi:superoxide dismutase family protein [Streptomyces polyrhachis]|uniref:Superoxide dismutase family protein n=1 Tax=Streptomyces polyrhachis TaxID=1282885 RepID=A0ABW2GM42_9ACTN
MRKALTATALLLAAAALPAATPAAAAPVGQQPPQVLVHSARFAPPMALIPSDAVTYDMELVPAGAYIAVAQMSAGRASVVRLAVDGLLPDRRYGAHVHTRPCGALPQDSGPHYQRVPDPVQPSVDPAYANPANEVWLDFTTNAAGRAAALAAHGWRLRAGEARSIVIHEEGTADGETSRRVGCFTVPLR